MLVRQECYLLQHNCKKKFIGAYASSLVVILESFNLSSSFCLSCTSHFNGIQSLDGTSAHRSVHPRRGYRLAPRTSRCLLCKRIIWKMSNTWCQFLCYKIFPYQKSQRCSATTQTACEPCQHWGIQILICLIKHAQLRFDWSLENVCTTNWRSRVWKKWASRKQEVQKDAIEWHCGKCSFQCFWNLAGG